MNRIRRKKTGSWAVRRSEGNTELSMNLRAHAKGTGFVGVRFIRRAGRHGSTAGETPATTVAISPSP
jgi:hypothetical protein